MLILSGIYCRSDFVLINQCDNVSYTVPLLDLIGQVDATVLDERKRLHGKEADILKTRNRVPSL